MRRGERSHLRRWSDEPRTTRIGHVTSARAVGELYQHFGKRNGGPEALNQHRLVVTASTATASASNRDELVVREFTEPMCAGSWHGRDNSAAGLISRYARDCAKVD